MQQSSEESIPQLLLTVQQAASSLNISRAKLYAIIDKGEGPPVIHLGRSTRIRFDALKTWVETTEKIQQANV
jgi:excisionase family DNA binding protein